MTEPEPWDDAKIREAFIYDGGEAEYHDPIHGAETHRKVAGETFDRWLKAHDAALREKTEREVTDERAKDERRSWATLVPENVLYPKEFTLLGTTTGAGMRARRDGNRLYVRNFGGLLQPIPGEVWLEVDSGRRFLVLATAEYRHHAVIDVTEYAGPIPEPRKS